MIWVWKRIFLPKKNTEFLVYFWTHNLCDTKTIYQNYSTIRCSSLFKLTLESKTISFVVAQQKWRRPAFFPQSLCIRLQNIFVRFEKICNGKSMTTPTTVKTLQMRLLVRSSLFWWCFLRHNNDINSWSLKVPWRIETNILRKRFLSNSNKLLYLFYLFQFAPHSFDKYFSTYSYSSYCLCPQWNHLNETK